MSGELLIRAVSASLTRKTERFGKMNPYVKVKVGNFSVHTEADMNGSLNPKWENNLLIRRHREDSLIIEVWNLNRLLPNALIGAATISFEALIAYDKPFKEYREWIPLKYKGKISGNIYVEMIFYPDVIYRKPLQEIKAEVPRPLETQTLEIKPARRTIMDSEEENIPLTKKISEDSQPTETPPLMSGKTVELKLEDITLEEASIDKTPSSSIKPIENRINLREVFEKSLNYDSTSGEITFRNLEENSTSIPYTLADISALP
jgi:hypothetical protein